MFVVEVVFVVKRCWLRWWCWRWFGGCDGGGGCGQVVAMVVVVTIVVVVVLGVEV